MSYYQTYRPRKIAELDLASVRDALTTGLSSGSLSHAYLFVGPRGSGKTSTARILAQTVNCAQNIDKKEKYSEPCGICEACQVVSRGSSVDVIEIDAASNGLVDDIRDLREKVRLSPVQLTKKVYIIDEVHMVSTSGFNALLKTLEEPPSHVLFILCTTESQKIPETIVSRCTKINFTKASMEEVVRSLLKAVEGEGLEIEESVLIEIAGATDGSFREGHKLLEQIAAYGNKITESVVAKVLGIAGKQSVKKLMEAAIGGRTDEVVEIFEHLEKSGTKASILAMSLLSIAKEDLEKSYREGGNPQKYLKLIDGLITAADRIKISPLPLLPIEIVLLSCGHEGGGASEPPKVSAPARNSTGVSEDKATGKNLMDREDVVVESNIVVHDFSDSVVSLDQVKTEWLDFLNSMASSNGSLAGMLRLVSPVDITGKSLTLSVTSKFQQEMLERDVKRRLIEEHMAKVWGPMTFRCVLEDKVMRTKPAEEDNNLVEPKKDVVSHVGVIEVAEKIFGE